MPLPAFAEFAAPATWQAVDFIGDLHLSEATPRSVEALATHLRCTDADAVFILGDLFEVWVGDDARHEGFEAACAAMLARASERRPIAFMAGNRDFLVGAEMLRQVGLTRLADPTLLLAFGQRLLLTHGDALCLADAAYQRFRTEVRGDPWQQRFLSRPLAERRAIARDMRAESEAIKRGQKPGDWVDVDAAEAAAWMRAAATPVMVHGHTHQPATHAVAPGLTRHVLSDWDFDHAARGDVLRWHRGGFDRVPPATGR
jgi:UDP-2,3-diacylglucosamine hydrolase